MKLHLLALGPLAANADFVDLEEEEDEDDYDVLEVMSGNVVTWDQITV